MSVIVKRIASLSGVLRDSSKARIGISKAVLNTKYLKFNHGGTFFMMSRNSSNRNWNTKNYVPHSLWMSAMLSFFSIKEDEKEEDPVVKVIKLGILALQRGEFVKAEKQLHLALRMSQERADPQAEVYCFDVLANIAFQRGDYQKAEKLFIETMKRMINLGKSENDEAFVEISLKLAKIYSRFSLDIKAENGFKFCLNTQQKRVTDQQLENPEKQLNDEQKNTLALLGMVANWFAHFLLEKRRIEEAKTHLLKAHSIAVRVFGFDNPQTLTAYSDIGLIMCLQKRNREAIEIFESICNTEGVEQLEELPTYMCNLAVSYIAEDEFDKADLTLTKARSLALKNKDDEAIKEISECIAMLNVKRSEKEFVANRN